MTFYRASTKTALQERLDGEREEREKQAQEELLVATVPRSEFFLDKPRLSTFEVDLLDAWQQP